jgi:hypothetical protein
MKNLSNKQKALIGAGVALVILASIVFLALRNQGPVTETVRYRSGPGAFELTYRRGPEGYVLRESALETSEIVKEISWISSADAALQGSQGGEGPKTIRATVYRNDEALTLERWLEKNGAARFGPIAGRPAESVAAGVRMLAFRSQGLWQQETFLFARGGRIIAFTVDFDSDRDRIKEDFGAMLQTLQFN